MSKRKETRSTCVYAMRHKATPNMRTEFYVLNYDGEASDAADFIQSYADYSLGNDDLALQMEQYFRDAGFLCSAVTIVKYQEKIAYKQH